MDITTKKGRRGRKDIDRIIVEKGRRGDFSPLQPDHYHSFYEIFYLWSGSCRFLLKDTVYQPEIWSSLPRGNCITLCILPERSARS